MKIITFPFAGGNKYSFNFLKHEAIKLKALEYPGRGQRISEPLLNNINDILEDALNNIISEIGTEDYIIYGHSLGALVGYLCCKKIGELNMKQPDKLIVSGYRAPFINKKESIYNLESDKFWEKIDKYGGIPQDVLLIDELITFFEPILRADFQCVENYVYNSSSDKLTIPINVFYGSDEDITQEEAESWQKETTGKVTVTKLKGNHFFIFDHKDFFINYFENLQSNATF